MMQPNKQLAMANDKADELDEGGATLDGAEFAEHVARGLDKVRKHIYAAIQYLAFFHCEVEDLVDMEEITEETKQKPKWQFDL